MNVRIVAALLLADKELEDLERLMKRKHDWRSARKIANMRIHLTHAMDREQEGLQAMFAEFQDEAAMDQPLQP